MSQGSEYTDFVNGLDKQLAWQEKYEKRKKLNKVAKTVKVRNQSFFETNIFFGLVVVVAAAAAYVAVQSFM